MNSNGTRYTTSDNLGAPRVVTNSSAAVVSRHDYKPFGEEIASGVGGRTTAMGYSVADGVRQGFTGYEADAETTLNFAQARYQSALQGRFTNPDRLLVDQIEEQPQSWNLYSYAQNNPLRYIDPLGLAHYDANSNYVGDTDGEFDKDLNATWHKDKKKLLGGYWDFGGNQSPVEVVATPLTWREQFGLLWDDGLTEQERRNWNAYEVERMYPDIDKDYLWQIRTGESHPIGGTLFIFGPLRELQALAEAATAGRGTRYLTRSL